MSELAIESRTTQDYVSLPRASSAPLSPTQKILDAGGRGRMPVLDEDGEKYPERPILHVRKSQSLLKRHSLDEAKSNTRPRIIAKGRLPLHLLNGEQSASRGSRSSSSCSDSSIDNPVTPNYLPSTPTATRMVSPIESVTGKSRADSVGIPHVKLGFKTYGGRLTPKQISPRAGKRTKPRTYTGSPRTLNRTLPSGLSFAALENKYRSGGRHRMSNSEGGYALGRGLIEHDENFRGASISFLEDDPTPTNGLDSYTPDAQTTGYKLRHTQTRPRGRKRAQSEPEIGFEWTFGQLAKNPHFLVDYSKLRPWKQFKKYQFRSKHAIQHDLLTHQTLPLKKTLCLFKLAECKSAHHKSQLKSLALENFNDVLGCMSASAPPEQADVALRILKRGIEHALLRDAIFAHLIKQTTYNTETRLPEATTQLFLWKLLYLCINSFSPSDEMGKILLSHISQLVPHDTSSEYEPAASLMRTPQDVASRCYDVWKQTSELGPVTEAPSRTQVLNVLSLVSAHARKKSGHNRNTSLYRQYRNGKSKGRSNSPTRRGGSPRTHKRRVSRSSRSDRHSYSGKESIGDRSKKKTDSFGRSRGTGTPSYINNRKKPGFSLRGSASASSGILNPICMQEINHAYANTVFACIVDSNGKLIATNRKKMDDEHLEECVTRPVVDIVETAMGLCNALDLSHRGVIHVQGQKHIFTCYDLTSHVLAFYTLKKEDTIDLQKADEEMQPVLDNLQEMLDDS